VCTLTITLYGGCALLAPLHLLQLCNVLATRLSLLTEFASRPECSAIYWRNLLRACAGEAREREIRGQLDDEDDKSGAAFSRCQIVPSTTMCTRHERERKKVKGGRARIEHIINMQAGRQQKGVEILQFSLVLTRSLALLYAQENGKMNLLAQNG
jgi:hypothetical protein